MTLTKSQLKEQLTQGNHGLVIQSLLILAPKLDSVQLENEIVHTSERFYRIEKNNAEGLISSNEFNLEKNKLNYTILTIIDSLPIHTIEVPDGELSKIKLYAKGKQLAKPKWLLYVGIATGVLVVICYFAFKKKPTSELPGKQLFQQETMNSSKHSTNIPDTMPKDLKTQSSNKEKTNINIKDKAKVGIISTGDSAVFNNVKQDF